MPLHRYNVRARRIKLFTRTIKPSLNTFINNTTKSSKSDLSSSIVKSGNMLHSKSTYFYHGGNSSSGKRLSSKLTYVVPGVCGLAFLVGLGMAINPAISSSLVHAESSSGDVEPSISISFPTTGLPEGYTNNAVETTPVVPGVVAYRSNYFDVTVKNPSWYAVSVRAAKGYTSELKNGEASIVGVGENVLPANFKENTWGYALTKVPTLNTIIDDSILEYNTLPDENTALISNINYTEEQNQTIHYKVSFATLFSGDTPSGHYATKVYLFATIDPGRVAGIFGPATMQEMGRNPQSCEAAAEGTTARLADERDGKYYWVTKLKDGNCWMTQNLDFDIPEELSSRTSNIDEISLKTGISGPTNINRWSSSTYNAGHYADPGDFYYSYAKNIATSNSICSNVVTLASNLCTAYFTAVTPDMPESNWHYHIGNYYNFAAATAGSGYGMPSGDALWSICPTGWKLPRSKADDIDSGSFGGLLASYGLDNNSNNLSTKDSATYANPMYFVYGGYISQYSGTLVNAAYESYYLSSTVPRGSEVSKLMFRSTNLISQPNNGGYQTDGISIRCVLTVD